MTGLVAVEAEALRKVARSSWFHTWTGVAGVDETLTELGLENLKSRDVFAIDNSISDSTKLVKPSKSIIGHEKASAEDVVMSRFRCHDNDHRRCQDESSLRKVAIIEDIVGISCRKDPDTEEVGL